MNNETDKYIVFAYNHAYLNKYDCRLESASAIVRSQHLDTGKATDSVTQIYAKVSI